MPDLPAQPPPPRQSVLTRYPLVSFFVMAYAFTWIVISPWTLGATGAGLLPVDLAAPATGPLLAAGILAGPALAAIIMAAVTEGRTGVHRLLARLVLWRVGARWYLLALLGVPLIMLLGFLVYAMARPDLGALGGPVYGLTYLVEFVLIMILGGPLFEEIGWRGFALPRLQRRYGPLTASLVLGVLWAFWHLPQFLVPAWAASSGGGGISGIVLFVLVAVAFSVVFSWVFNNTRASLLIAVLVHTSIDAFSTTMGTVYPTAAASAWPMIIGFGVVAVVLIAVTRGRLSYDQLQDAPPTVRSPQGPLPEGGLPFFD
jgi:membrane protease YdiL (CAAX protease family)